MAKKFGKLMLFSALAGAAAAGTYYYLQNKRIKAFEEDDYMDDLDDDLYDFDDDLDFESDINGTNSNIKNRSYVSLDLDNAKEIIGEKVIETIDKTKEKIENLNVTELVNEKLDKAKEFIEEITYTNNSEPAYTQVDMSSAKADSTENTDTNVSDAATDDTATGKIDSEIISDAYSNASSDMTEEFFDDSNEDL
ncbi:MAG: hypothetical protein II312_00675 [Lachnospiraceae bacterium]|nr:hypothetical protein [Lachnospiraceae bacterium]MEE0920330.1 hypothetical protein [Lachnospiraceae bacterium]